MFHRGIVLAQHKEPAFSKPVIRFVNPQTDSYRLDRKIPAKSEAEAVIEIARRARIVDERDGRLLARKLEKALLKAYIVIADAVDDEPYVSSRVAMILQFPNELTDGIDLCCRVAGCERSAIMAYKMVTDIETRVPRRVNRVKVVRQRGGYPADRAERMRRLGPGQKLVVGAGALVHLARAVYDQKVQTTVFVTVAGDCVAGPVNLEVSLGMTVMQVLERCGLAQEPTRVVCGGSMTGMSVIDPDNTLITFTTRAILAFRENARDRHYTCIGCGHCEQVCPEGLNPMYIHRFVENSYYANLKPFDAHLCTGCGTCSYICPSRLELASSVLKAKEYAESWFIRREEEDDEA
jgi:Na+-translocating ferredoxin:NAD+ oxidoreductase RnfC subunit